MENEEDKLDKEEIEFEQAKKEGFYQSDPHPESDAESNRKSGLAYSGGLALGGSIVIFSLLGLAIDSAFQINPWGIVIGVIFGSILGFYQFIRISSKIN